MLPGASPSPTPVEADCGQPDAGAWLADSRTGVEEQAPREAPEKRQNPYFTNSRSTPGTWEGARANVTAMRWGEKPIPHDAGAAKKQDDSGHR